MPAIDQDTLQRLDRCRDLSHSPGMRPVSDQDHVIVFDGAHLRATCYFPDRARLIVCFDHWRQERDGFPTRIAGAQGLEKFGCAVLNIHSHRNDWMLNAELPELRAALQDSCSTYTDVTAFGFSMGGYSALLLARNLHLARAILISPQYSIQPTIVPFERRYLKEATAIRTDLDRFDLEFGKTLRGAVIYDPLWKEDRAHKKLICRDFPALTPVPMWAGGHPAIKMIYEARRWGEFLAQVAQPDPDMTRFMKLHKTVRAKSDRYFRAMTNHLAVRSNQRK